VGEPGEEDAQDRADEGEGRRGLRQKEQEEAAKMKEVPDINREYQLKNSQVPIHMRQSYDVWEGRSEQKREYQTKREQEDEAECTFVPNGRKRSLTPKAKMDHVDKLINWKKEKDSNLIHKITTGAYEERCTHHPQVNEKSKQMAEKRNVSGDIVDRLYQAQKARDEHVQKILEDEQKNMFAPKINSNSKKIILNSGKKSSLIKLKEVENENLKYYSAVVPGQRDIRELNHIEKNIQKIKEAKKPEPQSEKKPVNAYAHINSRYRREELKKSKRDKLSSTPTEYQIVGLRASSKDKQRSPSRKAPGSRSRSNQPNNRSRSKQPNNRSRSKQPNSRSRSKKLQKSPERLTRSKSQDGDRKGKKASLSRSKSRSPSKSKKNNKGIVFQSVNFAPSVASSNLKPTKKSGKLKSSLKKPASKPTQAAGPIKS
jgi:hypothetical protein